MAKKRVTNPSAGSKAARRAGTTPKPKTRGVAVRKPVSAAGGVASRSSQAAGSRSSQGAGSSKGAAEGRLDGTKARLDGTKARRDAVETGAGGKSRGGGLGANHKSAAVADAAPVQVVKMDSGLSARDIEELRQMLLEKRSQLIGDVNNLHNEAMRSNRQDAAGDLSSMPIHMADIGTDNYEQEFTLGLIEGERAILRDIEAALARITAGTYGLCLATGRPIGKARLKANPWAKYCYEYTLQQEKGRTRRF